MDTPDSPELTHPDARPRHRPEINRNRCEAKGPCVEVCPYDVFEIQPLRDEDRAKLSWIGRLKARAHGHRQAYVVRPQACSSCALCVLACPEKAIKLLATARP